MQVIKRNGTSVPFDKSKIVTAILKAFLDVDGQIYELDTATSIANDIEKDLSENFKNKDITVEIIQDLVEEYLMQSERSDVARAYIRFRYKQEVARKYRNEFIDAIKDKLGAKDVQNQNANVDEHSFGGRTGEAASLVTRTLALDYLLSPMAKSNHLNNEIYIHDLDSYYIGNHNCLSIPFDDLLANGFTTRQADVRPAGSISTAMQLIAVIFQLQSLQQFGGVSATHLDWTMVPYVRKSFAKHYRDGLKYLAKIKESDIDYEITNMLTNVTNYSIKDPEWENYNNEVYEYTLDLVKREAHQAAEGLIHNLKI